MGGPSGGKPFIQKFFGSPCAGAWLHEIRCLFIRFECEKCIYGSWLQSCFEEPLCGRDVEWMYHYDNDQRINMVWGTTIGKE